MVRLYAVEKIRKKLMKAAGINTIGSTRKQMAELKENYFPVDGVSYESYNGDEEYGEGD